MRPSGQRRAHSPQRRTTVRRPAMKGEVPMKHLNRMVVRVAVAASLAALAAFGAVALSGPEAGTAAAQIKPTNTDPPTISGTPAVGSTLTADPGKWTGTEPITFTYQWRRCNRTGGSCSNISGSTGKTYELSSPDRNNTLRVRVTAHNADGTAVATSVPTAVVAARPTTTTGTPPAANGCPSGTGVINVAQLNSPARLLLDRQDVSPSVIGGSTQQLAVRFHVSACNERPVQGALVYVTAVPFSQFSIPTETATGADGWASMTMTRLSGFPAARKQQLLVLFARARKPGENVLAGISTRRLVSFRVELSR